MLDLLVEIGVRLLAADLLPQACQRVLCRRRQRRLAAVLFRGGGVLLHEHRHYGVGGGDAGLTSEGIDLVFLGGVKVRRLLAFDCWWVDGGRVHVIC